jgi:hypothetical protein
MRQSKQARALDNAGAPVDSPSHVQSSNLRWRFSEELKSRAVSTSASLKTFTQNRPVASIRSWQETVLLTQTRSKGEGSADTDVTEVATKPCGVSPSIVVMMETPAASLRIASLNSMGAVMCVSSVPPVTHRIPAWPAVLSVVKEVKAIHVPDIVRLEPESPKTRWPWPATA